MAFRYYHQMIDYFLTIPDGISKDIFDNSVVFVILEQLRAVFVNVTELAGVSVDSSKIIFICNFFFTRSCCSHAYYCLLKFLMCLHIFDVLILGLVQYGSVV